MLETIGDIWILVIVIFFVIAFSIILIALIVIAFQERAKDTIVPLVILIVGAIVFLLVCLLLGHIEIDLLTPLENYFNTPI